MKITDLTHIIHSDMPVFPGTEQPIFEKANTLKRMVFERLKSLCTHIQVHI